ncbi:hypothetical protein DICVIV_09882 [Dictyocaulus viviparus]|uniref:Uncharacterized protein n=1 Tax=Dictyocaulus viviparus TaxID=29172 RepID=A0A0D8XK23_DICVI|nr:hypothetical protein DICVIV_09882 [Dictyocaulus viviparus]
MSLHDDSKILSQLGILASKDESPHKVRYSSKAKISTGKDRFVDVNIDGSIDLHSESEEEAIFDRKTLLSPNRDLESNRRKPESYRYMCIILLMIYFAMGIWYPLTRFVTLTSKEVFSGFLFENSTGLLLGSVFAKLFCGRLNIILFSFFCTAATCFLSWTMSYFAELIDTNILSFLLGLALGNLFYVGMAIWFMFWRGCNRKGLLLYVILAASSLFVLFLNNAVLFSGDFTRFQVTTQKRETNGSRMEDNSVKFQSINNSTSAKPRKPQIVQGIRNVQSKSERNNQMRKAAETNITQIPSMGSAEINNSTIVLHTDGYQQHNDMNYVPTISHANTNAMPISSSEMYWSRFEFFFLWKREKKKNFVLYSTSLPLASSSSIYDLNKRSSMEKYVANIVITTITICYLMAFVCCYIPFTVKTDTRFSKLFDPTIAGLTRSCRLRLATLQIIASALESMSHFHLVLILSLYFINSIPTSITYLDFVELAAIMFSSKSNISNIYVLHYILIVTSRLIVLLSGPFAYSYFGCCLALICCSLGSISLLSIFRAPIVSFVLLTIGSRVFGLLVFFHLEVRIYPRSGTQLDYFILPSIIGRFLFAVFCTLLQPVTENHITGAILLLSALLVVVFLLLSKSVGKAARLKEIMEYSSSPVFDTFGEYVSLIERDVASDSSEDKNKLLWYMATCLNGFL